MVCTRRSLAKVLQAHDSAHPYEEPARDVYSLVAPPLSDTGMGRVVRLSSPIELEDAVERVKKHVNLPHVRLARALNGNTQIKSVAVCAGSGSSVLRGTNADLWVTGEASHHDVIAATEKGVSVILCEHSNTERGYIQSWMLSELTKAFEEHSVQVLVSKIDSDPLKIV